MASTILFCINTTADESIILYILDSTSGIPLQENIVWENEKYDIAIGYENQTGFAYNVTIQIPWDPPYLTSPELPYITITIPDYIEYQQFLITATKPGYQSDEQTIEIYKGELQITTDQKSQDENTIFTVIVRDHKNSRIYGAEVYIDGEEITTSTATTNINGVANLYAPSVNQDSAISITAIKQGYLPGQTTLNIINTDASTTNSLTVIIASLLNIAPYLLAILAVIGAILFVRYRNRSHRTYDLESKKSYKSSKTKKTDELKPEVKISKSHQKLPTGKTNHEFKSHPTSNQAKIEEIRIVRDKKEKEIKQIKETPEEPHMQKKDGYKWFEGTDDMRYKIDKLTGEIDEEFIDKWFEGIEDIRSKVDEKLKKNLKKKD